MGNSNAPFARVLKRPVQPHASGEQIKDFLTRPSLVGSAPREWGTAIQNASTAVIGRFSPTRVGNRLQWPLMPVPVAVQPHASGEQGDRELMALWPDGSAPREWGTALN